jgi:hypothetical protein
MSFSAKTKKTALLTGVFLLVLPSLLVFMAGRSSASTLTDTYVRLNRIKSGTATSFRVVFKAASTQTANLTIDFNGTDSGTAQWTNATPGGLVNTSQTVSTAQCVTDGFTVLPTSGTLSAAGSGAVVTVSSVGATTSGQTYCVDLTSSSAVTTPTAGHEGEYHPTVAIGTDSTTVAVRIISEDSVTVTATVPPSFNFSFNNTTADAFGNLTTAGNSTTGKTITLSTNANTGWVVWAKSTNGASKGSLKSVAAGNYVITSASSLGSASHTLGSNTEDYGLAITSLTDGTGSGTPAADGAYDSTAGTKLGVLDSQNFRPIASSDGPGSGDAISFLERASINGATPAANDYTDTITFIGAGSF